MIENINFIFPKTFLKLGLSSRKPWFEMNQVAIHAHKSITAHYNEHNRHIYHSEGALIQGRAYFMLEDVCEEIGEQSNWLKTLTIKVPYTITNGEEAILPKDNDYSIEIIIGLCNEIGGIIASIAKDIQSNEPASTTLNFLESSSSLEITFTNRTAEEILQIIQDLKDNTFVTKLNDFIATETLTIPTEKPSLTTQT